MRPAPLILASASPRRLQLLAQLGVTPDRVVPADLDETPHSGEVPRAYARRLAREKAVAVHRPGQFTLAGDTVVALGARILPKADTDQTVADCLALLSGRAHRVFSAICLIGPDGRQASRLSATRVCFKRLSSTEIQTYCASGEGLGKAAGYAIQGAAGAFVRSINGSYSGVVGLPLYEASGLLRGLGYLSTSGVEPLSTSA